MLGMGRRAGSKALPTLCLPCPDHSQLTPAPASGEAAEDDHAHIQPLLDPDLAHDANHLQGEHVLAKVVPTLNGGREY